MPKIEIYFAGLICHVGPSEKEGSDRAGLVSSVLIPDTSATQHTPRIRIGTTSVTLDETLNGSVSFIGLGAGATAGSLFLDTVPHLDDLTRSGIELNLATRKPNVFPFTVQLPDGEFTVVEFYEKGAKWSLDGDVYTRPCVPRVTMLRASGSGVTVSFNDKSVPLNTNCWVLLTNLEKVPPASPGDDWKKQYAVTTAGTSDDLAGYEEYAGVVNKQPERGMWTAYVLKEIKRPPLVDTSECTNSHWP